MGNVSKEGFEDLLSTIANDSYEESEVPEVHSGLLHKRSLVPVFPAIPLSMETDTRPVCVVIARQGEYSSRLPNLHSLKTANRFP